MYYNYDYRTMPNENYGEDKLFNVDKGFLYGTIFENVYEGYKNYVPYEITPKTEKEALLLEVQKHVAMMNDLDLYLDIYPNTEKFTKIYSECSNRYKIAVDNYEKNMALYA